MLLFLACFTVECAKELPSPASESSEGEMQRTRMGFETWLLLCAVPRVGTAFSVCLCVCRACSFTGLWLCPGAAVLTGEAEHISARVFL